MSHITDGDLHAYLDQALDAYGPSEPERIRAHLESCAACAQRLDAARALRERATGILGGAGPGAVSLASLEELKERAAATGGPTDGTSRSRLSWRSPYAIGLGWAATITLALFAGYSVKDRAPNPSGRPPMTLEAMRELDAVAADDQPGESDQKNDQLRASEAGAESEADAEAEALGLASSGEALRGGAGAPADVAAVAGEDQDFALDEERQRRRMADAELPERIDAALRDEAVRVDPAPAPASEVFADARANEIENLEVAGTARNARKTLAQESSQEGAAAVDGMLLITGERGSAGVPGLEIGRTDAVELPGIGHATLIVHVLPSGGDLELWSLATSELAAASPGTDLEDRAAEITAYFRNSLPRGWSMAVLERPGGYLVARAPLLQAELDALMERVPDGG